jgi:hypothetical protein
MRTRSYVEGALKVRLRARHGPHIRPRKRCFHRTGADADCQNGDRLSRGFVDAGRNLGTALRRIQWQQETRVMTRQLYFGCEPGPDVMDLQDALNAVQVPPTRPRPRAARPWTGV